MRTIMYVIFVVGMLWGVLLVGLAIRMRMIHVVTQECEHGHLQ